MTLPGPGGATGSSRIRVSTSRLRILMAMSLLSIGLLLFAYNTGGSSDYLNKSKTASSSSSSTSSSSPVTGVNWPLKDKLEYFESVYQESLRRREKELKRRQYGTVAFNPWDSWMSWWSYFPAAFTCPFDIQRVGNFGDGGKWVCGMRLLESPKVSVGEQERGKDQQQQRPCVVYSLGVATESSFEEELLRRTDCEIWAFDGSVDMMGSGADNNPRVHFQKVFIGKPQAGVSKAKRGDPASNTEQQQQQEEKQPNTAAVVPWKTLSSIMQQNQHEWIDILKIDIEGYEYGALDALLADPAFSSVLPFSQLQIELHLTDPDMSVQDPKSFSRFLNWFQSLESRGLRPFWSELNMIPALLTKFEMGMYFCEFSFFNIRGQHRLLGY